MSGPLPPDGLRLLKGQLGRMRAMLYRTYELFYRFIGAGLTAVGLVFVGAFWPPGAYLVWHVVGRRDQRTLEAILADAYNPAPGAEPA